MQNDVRASINRAISEEMERDKNVFIMGEEVGEYDGAYKVTKGLLQKFGNNRVIDTPITEHGFVGLAVGAAFMGLRPIVEFMTFNFGMQAIDQIINSAAKTYFMSGGQINVPIVFRGPNGNAFGTAAQHSQCFISWYASVPGLKVIAPFFPKDHRLMLKAAIRDDNPVVFLENELLYPYKGEDNLVDSDIIGQIGKANVVKEGSDVTIIAFSYSMLAALDAIDVLFNKYEIKAELIDLVTIRPLDVNCIINSFKKTNKMVIVESGWQFSGIAAEISACVIENAFDYIDAPVKRVSGADIPMPYARNLEIKSVPSSEDVVNAVCDIFGIK